jgi:hypothetical protein
MTTTAKDLSKAMREAGLARDAGPDAVEKLRQLLLGKNRKQRPDVKRITFAGDWPACTTLADYKEWREFGKRCPPRYNFCEDCTPEYQARMIREFRCENPRIQFSKDADGFVSGYLPSRYYEMLEDGQ